MNIFSELIYSFVGVKKYPEFLKNKMGKVFGYVELVVLIFTVLAQLMTIPNTTDFINETREALLEFPDFELKSGKLNMEESFYFDESTVLVMIESEYGSYINETDTSDWYQMLAYYDMAFVLDETTLLVKNEGEIQVMDYPADFELSRDDIEGMLEYIYIFVGIYIVFYYLFSLGGYFLAALLVALAGMIICSFMKQKLTFGQLYLLALYAKTLPYLVKGIFKLFSFDFFGYSIVAFAVACVYLGLAIRHMDVLEEDKNKVEGPIVF